jgi:hypothetical protein
MDCLCTSFSECSIFGQDEVLVRFVEIQQAVRGISVVCCREIRHELCTFAVVNRGSSLRTSLSEAQPHPSDKVRHEVRRALEVEEGAVENFFGDEIMDQHQD